MIKQRLYSRSIRKHIVDALADTPVVLVSGPRQAGKTTLVRQLSTPEMRYLTLDDELTLLAAREDPTGMIRSLNRAVIDEVQRAPQLLLAIKKSVDEDRRPGRFLLTGSANLMLLPKVADSLAGRLETFTLLPFSQSELQESALNWIDTVFSGSLPGIGNPVIGQELVETVLRGGFPEAVFRTSRRRSTAWLRQYIAAIVQRDVRDIASIEKLDQLPRFLRALAQASGQMCNYTGLGGQVGLDSKTAAHYAGVLEQMFLLKRLEPWGRNRLKRLVKTSKLQFIDAGVLAFLMDFGIAEAERDRRRFGNVLESFVYSELLKHATAADGDYRLLYYRDLDKVEVDIVIENAAGQVVGVEVKAGATVRSDDLRGLKKLAAAAGNDFALGVLLYDGNETLPLGNRIWAAPLSTLWAAKSRRVGHESHELHE